MKFNQMHSWLKLVVINNRHIVENKYNGIILILMLFDIFNYIKK
jgi:hypothetical protein